MMPYASIVKWGAGILGGLVFAWLIYAGLLKPVLRPNPTTRQSAETIINHQYGTPKVYFGCLNLRVYERKEVTNQANP